MTPNEIAVMHGTRVRLTVEVDLDLVPGAMYDADDAAMRIEALLTNVMSSYRPTVRIQPPVETEA